MSETQKASTGFNGEAWISTDETAGNLEELVQVVSFSLPDITAEQVETTHLKSPGRMREYTAGMIDPGEIEIVLNFRPGSATDVLLEAAHASAIAGGVNRYVRLGVPELGTTTRMYNFLGAVLNYSKGEVTADGKLEATVTIGVRSVPTTGNWVEPT